MKSKKVLKLLVPVLIVAVIAAIWVIRNQPTPSDEEGMTQAVVASLPEGVSIEDFNLRETQAIDYEQLTSHGIPVIVDYGADSCIPCKEMAPVLEKANAVFAGKAFVKFINVWDYPDAANNVPVQVIPTQVLFGKDGKPFMPSEKLAGEIQFDMYSTRDTGEHVFTVHQGGLTEAQMWSILGEMGVTE